MSAAFISIRALAEKLQICALLALLTLVLLCPPQAIALQPSLDITQYAHTSWTTRDGLLKGAVRSIAQTPDGYLWLGTEFGLVRFDGARFTPWNPDSGQHLPSSNIRSLLAARDGTLWIGTLEGLTSLKDGKLKEYSQLAHQNVLTLLEDHEGRVWAGSFGVPKARLCAIYASDVNCYGDDGSLGQWVWSLYEDGQNRLWVGAESGLWRWTPGPPQRFAIPYSLDTAQAIIEDEKGALLVVLGDGVFQLADQKITAFRFPTPPGRITLLNLFRDRDGGTWMGTLDRGLFHVFGGKTSVFAQTDGLSSDHILCLFEDREGNIWVGTSEGLDRFRQTTAFSISVKQGLSSPSVQSVLVAHDNSVWLSTLDGLNHWKDGHNTIYWAAHSTAAQTSRARTPQQSTSVFHAPGTQPLVTEITDPVLPDNRPGSLYEDDRRRIWISTPKGIVRFENGKFTLLKEIPAGWVNAIVGDTHGGVWISDQDLGLLHWVDGKLTEKFPWSALGGNVIASAVLPDVVRGGLWLGFFQGGVSHFKDGRIDASFATNDGLGHGRVMGLQLDHDGTLWAATEGGLSRLKDGPILTLTSANGLPCDTVHWTVEVDSSFWLYTACGLLRIPRAELKKWAKDPARTVPFTIFDRTSGVRNRALLAGYTPRVSQSADQTLWFANLQSVTVIDPRHLFSNQIPPPVRIERIAADSRVYDPVRGLRLPPRVRDLTIDYTALSFTAPEKVRFRFMLQGQDPEWREVVNDRHVQYSNLAPGHYRFRVTACNDSGVWNEQGEIVDFSVAPAYWQTNWFRSLCLGAVLALIWAIYQIRVRQLAHQFNLSLEARVSERTRIARELHDTLLQSFHGLLLRFQTALRLLPERPVDARAQLESAINQAEDALVEGRDAVQGLRASTVQHNDLAEAISALGEELATESADSSHAAFRVMVEGTPRMLHPMVRDEIYRIAAEALRNAFRHAEAHQIEVEIRYDGQEFRLRVRDDGRGFELGTAAAQDRKGHYGLRGMRERAKIAGGTLRVWSEIGAGTELELQIPAVRAYAKPARRKWFSVARSSQ